MLSRQLESQPISPQELFVKHAVFAAEFGELPSLDPFSRQMSVFTFYMIDILLFLFALFLLTAALVSYGSRAVLEKITKQKKE